MDGRLVKVTFELPAQRSGDLPGDRQDQICGAHFWVSRDAQADDGGVKKYRVRGGKVSMGDGQKPELRPSINLLYSLLTAVVSF